MRSLRNLLRPASNTEADSAPPTDFAPLGRGPAISDQLPIRRQERPAALNPLRSQRGDAFAHRTQRGDSSTIAQVERLRDFSLVLTSWAMNAPPGERRGRSDAMLRIRFAYLNGVDELNLHDFGLSTLPNCLDRLTSVNRLTLSGNALTTLPALPPSLVGLDVRNSGLTSAASIPTNLTELYVDIGANRLSDLSAEHINALSQHTVAQVQAQVEAHAQARAQAESALRQPMQVPNPRPNPGPNIMRSAGVSELVAHAPPPSSAGSLQRERPFPENDPTVAQCFQFWQPKAFRNDPAREAKWNNIADEVKAVNFSGFLKNLCLTAEYRDRRIAPDMSERVSELMQELFDSPKFRGTCFTIATDALETCHDRITHSLNEMSLALIDHRAEDGRFTQAGLVNMGRGLFRVQVLNTIADEIVIEQDKIFAANPIVENEVDPIEIKLAFHTKLGNQLNLPSMAREMKYMRTAKIAPEAFDEAVTRVTKLESEGAHIKHLATWRPWVKSLQRRYPEECAKFEKDLEANRDWLVFPPDAMTSTQYGAAGKDEQGYEESDRMRFMVKLTWRYLAEEQTA